MKRSGLRKWVTWNDRIHQVMWLSLGVGLFVGIGLTVGIIALTQSWFGWGW